MTTAVLHPVSSNKADCCFYLLKRIFFFVWSRGSFGIPKIGGIIHKDFLSIKCFVMSKVELTEEQVFAIL